MGIEIKAWLYDILNAISEIESFVPSSFDEYMSDVKTRRAVERNLEIIGEAMNRILKKDDSINITNARKIVDFRNVIAHSYDSVADKVVWSIIIDQLPKLQEEASVLLGE
ncbi:MAG: HepT-like ribonuclease domain-containing protein [Bacteroidota bacterium]